MYLSVPFQRLGHRLGTDPFGGVLVGERSGRTEERYAIIDDASAAETEVPDITLLREWAENRLERLYTAPGRRLGASRSRFMETFFEQFEDERRPIHPP